MKGIGLKASRFNVFIPEKGRTCIYNCATGKWDWFSVLEASQIQKNRTSSLSPQICKNGLAMGALIDVNRSENEWYEKAYQMRAHAAQQAFYVIALSFKCNLKCYYCFEKNPRYSIKTMTKPQLMKLVGAIKQRALEENSKQLGIMLFGGEPLLELEKFLYLLKELKEWSQENDINFLGTVSTNGVLMTKEIVTRLQPYIQSVQVTFDGPRSIHDKIRITGRNEPTFKKITQAIRWLKEAGIRISIRAQVSAENQNNLLWLIDELKEENLLDSPNVKVSVGILRDFSKWSSCADKHNYIEPGSDMEKTLLDRSDAVVPVQRPAVQFIPCITVGNMLCVDPLGNLYKCVTSLTDVDQRVGHLNSQGKFVFSDHYQEFYQRNPLQFEDCQSCAFLPHCGGGCPKSAKATYGSYQHSFCGSSKTLLTNLIRRLVLSHETEIKN